jgi:hypothetical protein
VNARRSISLFSNRLASNDDLGQRPIFHTVAANRCDGRN